MLYLINKIKKDKKNEVTESSNLKFLSEKHWTLGFVFCFVAHLVDD